MKKFSTRAPAPPPSAAPQKAASIVDVSGLDLGQLRFTVPPVERISEEELFARFGQLLREHAKVTERAKGALVEPGDEIQVNLIIRVGGQLVPGGVWDAHWIRFDEDPLAFLKERAVGMKVGSRQKLDVAFPTDHPAPALAGKTAQCDVEILAAEHAAYLNPDNPAELKKLGRGETADEVVKSLLRDAIDDATRARDYQLRESVVDAILERVEVKLDPAMLDKVLEALWAEREQPGLVERGANAAEQKRARAFWLEDQELRDEYSRSLKMSAVLRAVAERDGLKLDKAHVMIAVESVATALESTIPEVGAALKKDRQLDLAVSETAMQLLVWEHILGKVVFEEAEKKPDARSFLRIPVRI